MAYWHDCWQQNNVASIGDDGESVICFFPPSLCPLGSCLSVSESFSACLPVCLPGFFLDFFFYLSLKAFVHLSNRMIVCLLILFCFHFPLSAPELRKIVVESSWYKLGCLVADQLHSFLSQPVNWIEAQMAGYAPPYIIVGVDRISKR